MDIPKNFEAPEETAGVGSIDGVYYMWALDEEKEEVTVVFDCGEFIKIRNEIEGWTDFIEMAHSLSKRTDST